MITPHELVRYPRPAPTSGFDGAQPLGLHFEGPFLNPLKKGAHNPAYLRTPDTEFTRRWSRKSGVWVVTLAPENPGASDLILLLQKRGIVLSTGHSMATFEEARHAFHIGVSAATHLFNAMPALPFAAFASAVATPLPGVNVASAPNATPLVLRQVTAPVWRTVQSPDIGTAVAMPAVLPTKISFSGRFIDPESACCTNAVDAA